MILAMLIRQLLSCRSVILAKCMSKMRQMLRRSWSNQFELLTYIAVSAEKSMFGLSAIIYATSVVVSAISERVALLLLKFDQLDLGCCIIGYGSLERNRLSLDRSERRS